ncbi:MAG: hypothetical protein JNM56_23760 [Planctomycetia bacterium]|nr:hypothetical protein [Planctomycetia bacterium]
MSVASEPREIKTAFRSKNLGLVTRAVAILATENPMTLRHLFYRCISAGLIENSKPAYDRLKNIMVRLREEGDIPMTWLVDHVRSTLRPSSWDGLEDYAEAVRECYRKNFWANLPHCVEFFVEKDAMAGVLETVTRKYNIALHVIRGYTSISYAAMIARRWAQIRKPIFAYYVGDFDPSGFDLERDLREKLERYSDKTCIPNLQYLDEHLDLVSRGAAFSTSTFQWNRVGVLEEDFGDYDLIRLPVKATDKRAAKFVDKYGEDSCAEVDAIPPSDLRERVREVIEAHIDQDEWNRLLEVERVERESLQQIATGWEKSSLGKVSQRGGADE